MKAPKSVVKKTVGSARKKKPTSWAHKEPPCQIAGIYRTYAVIHQPGATYNSTSSLNTPTMFMEIGAKGTFVGEVSRDCISIAGSGRIKASMVPGKGLTIYQSEDEDGDKHLEMTNDCILTQIQIGAWPQYAGFISAIATPLAPGTVCITEPDLGPGFLPSWEWRPEQLGKPLGPVCTETKRGDIICKFTLHSFGSDAIEMYTHLMTSMPPREVAILRKRDLMCSSYSPEKDLMTTLCEMYEALK